MKTEFKTKLTLGQLTNIKINIILRAKNPLQLWNLQASLI